MFTGVKINGFFSIATRVRDDTVYDTRLGHGMGPEEHVRQCQKLKPVKSDTKNWRYVDDAQSEVLVASTIFC